MKRILTLETPFIRPDGLTQSSFEINYIYINDDGFTVYTKQGNVISFPVTEQYQEMLINIEDAVKAKLETQS